MALRPMINVRLPTGNVPPRSPSSRIPTSSAACTMIAAAPSAWRTKGVASAGGFVLAA